MSFIYLPLESYKERYTSVMSVKGGWIEDKLKKNNIEFIRVEGDTLDSSGKITTGVVLDFFGRSYYSLTQNAKVVKMIREGIIEDGDILYYEDFWTPGMEGVRYSAELAGVNLNIYAMLHAQSVDKYDFMAQMKYWVRHYEIGQSKFMRGIFVTSEYLQDLCEEAGLENVYFGGLPYNKEFILKKFPITVQKENQVLYCSRFDDEKNPELFIDIARKLKGRHKFVMTTSASEVRSNNSKLITAINKAAAEGIIELKTNLTKEQYYQELQRSMYQVNTAKQDWLSWTMIEALTYKCIPIYPKYRSFPEYLPSKYLYENESSDDAVRVIESINSFDNSLESVVSYYDKSFERYLDIMRLRGDLG